MADPNYEEPAEIETLFGIPILIQIALCNLVKSNDGLAMAQQSVLGYIIYQMVKREISGAAINTIMAKPTAMIIIVNAKILVYN